MCFKPRANGRNIVGCCMLRPFAHPVLCVVAARFETGQTFQPTTPNIVGATMLGDVASVCTQPYPAAYTFLSFEIAEVCPPLANWRLYKRHYLIIND